MGMGRDLGSLGQGTGEQLEAQPDSTTQQDLGEKHDSITQQPGLSAPPLFENLPRTCWNYPFVHSYLFPDFITGTRDSWVVDQRDTALSSWVSWGRQSSKLSPLIGEGHNLKP